MRAALCFLVLLSVLAPAGSIGITAAPVEAETSITAPRAGSAIAIERRTQLDAVEAARPPVSSRIPLRGTLRASAPASRSIPFRVVTVANPRAPPAA